MLITFISLQRYHVVQDGCYVSAETSTDTEQTSEMLARPDTAEEKHEAEATEKDTSEIAEDPPAPAGETAEAQQPKEGEEVKPAETEADEKTEEAEANDEVPPLNPEGEFV